MNAALPQASQAQLLSIFPGVDLLGRALARAVTEAYARSVELQRSLDGPAEPAGKCACGCGRRVRVRQRYYDFACRKRAQRKRERARTLARETTPAASAGGLAACDDAARLTGGAA